MLSRDFKEAGKILDKTALTEVCVPARCPDAA